MNIPNLITTARLVITAGVFVCLEAAVSGSVDGSGAEHPDTTLVWIAFTLFLVAAITDFLDGYLARKWNMVSAFGRIADPFADKVLIAGSLITLLQFPAVTEHEPVVLTTWYVVIVVAREFLVTAIRGFVEASGKPFGADRLGKYKMVAQCWQVGALLSMVAGADIFVGAAEWGFWVSLALTVVSGLNYCWKARGVLLEGAG